MTEKETWKPVVGFEGLYEVSDLGRVRSLDREIEWAYKSGKVALRLHKGRILSPSSTKKYAGYLQVNLHARKERKNVTVHSLVAAAFIGQRPPGIEIAHSDGNTHNNRVNNLRYTTSAENNKDKIKHGTHLFGETSPSAKLTRKEVEEIRSAKGVPQQTLADKYGVTFSNISAIQLRKSWRHV